MTRILFLVYLVGAIFCEKRVTEAFLPSTPLWSAKSCGHPSITTALGIQSKRRKGRSDRDNINEKNNGWDNFKRVFYQNVDNISELTSKIAGQEDDKSNNGISDGYSSFEQSFTKDGTPASKLVKEYEARATALGLDKARSSSSSSSSSMSNKKPRTSFEAFKESLYSASDSFGAVPIDPPKQSPLTKLGRNIPYKKSLAQELGAIERVDDLLSDDPVKRFQAQQEIREREAKLRAQTRNERIRAKKEDLYKVVDAMQAAVDALPESIDKTEKAIKDGIEVIKEVPNRVGKVVEDVKAIPTSVMIKADQTKMIVEDTIGKTKKVVKEVIDVPNKVTKKVYETQQAVINTKDSINEGVSNVKIALRLEKPKPKPPKLPPPKPKNAKEVALKVAGGAAIGVGKVAWWATKSVASAAWSGAQSAVNEREKSDFQPPRLPKPPSIPPPSKLDQQTAELQREVEEALRLAEETLRRVDEDK